MCVDGVIYINKPGPPRFARSTILVICLIECNLTLESFDLKRR